MFVFETVFFVKTAHTHFYQTGKTLTYNHLRIHKLKVKIKEKEKANDWMWQSHRESQLMIV